jgi:hypothetical protein
MLPAVPLHVIPQPAMRFLLMAYHLLSPKIMVFVGQVRSADPCPAWSWLMSSVRGEVKGMTEHKCSACGQQFNSENELREHEKTCKSK